MRRIVSLIAGGVLLASLGAAPVVAATGSQVTITAVHTFSDGQASFTASGGGLCPSGTVTVPRNIMTQGRSQHVNFIVRQVFTCDAGGGFTTEDAFFVQIEAHATVGIPDDGGPWQIMGGEGAFADLRGTGILVGNGFEGGVIDHLYGWVH